MSKVSTGEKILGAASLVLIVTFFLKLWGKVEVGGGLGDLGGLAGVGTVRYSASDIGGYMWIAFLCALAAVVFVVLRAAGNSPDLPFKYGQLYLGLGAVAALLLILRAVAGPPGGSFSGFGVESSRGIMMLVAPLFGLAMAGGGWMHMQEEGGAPAGGGFGPGPQAPPPTAPPPPPGP